MSYKAIIADDESFARMMLKTMIDWEAHDIRIIAEAENGRQALQLIEEYSPDILFLDISMPVMDGLTVLKELDKRFPIITVILSSYDDFEYVRYAMQMGTIDYLHKPNLCTGDLLRVIERIHTIQEERQQTQHQEEALKGELEKHRNALKPRFIKEVLFNPLIETLKEEDLARYSLILSNRFCCLYITVDNYRKVISRYEKEDLYLLMRGIETVFSSVGNKKCRFEYFPLTDGKYLLVPNLPSSSLKDDADFVRHLVNRLKKSMNQFLNIGITIGISSYYESVGSLRLCAEESRRANEKKFFLGTDSVIQFRQEYLSKNPVSPALQAFLQEKVKIIRDNLYENEYKEVWDQIHFLFLTVREEILLSRQSLWSYFVDIYCLINEQYIRYASPGEETDQDFLTLEGFIGSDCLDQIKDSLTEGVGLIRNRKAALNSRKPLNHNVMRAMEYINSFFMDQELSLTVIAEELNLNNSYLSRLFKKELSMTVTEYLHKCRLKKAKFYLKHTDMKHYEISGLVGYNNVEYFNVIFKKSTGMTPKAYRMKE